MSFLVAQHRTRNQDKGSLAHCGCVHCRRILSVTHTNLFHSFTRIEFLPHTQDYFFYVKLFNLCDTDGSGHVTHRELFKAMTEKADQLPESLVSGTHDRAGVSARITELDRDNDRSLSFVEFARALVRFK
jgi:hypothetical protein